MDRNERITNAYFSGQSMASLGREYGVSRNRIYEIVSKHPNYLMYRELKRKRIVYKKELDNILKPYRDNHKIYNRFWSQVEKNGCWTWTGYTHPTTGYGVFQCKEIMEEYNVSRYTHRMSWCLHNGEIPEGICVLHTCDTPSCVNPDHLYLGTQSENTRDRQERSGWTDYSRKLSDNEVDNIRRVFDNEGIDCLENIAKAYNITTHYAYIIGTRRDTR